MWMDLYFKIEVIGTFIGIALIIGFAIFYLIAWIVDKLDKKINKK